MRCDGLRGTLGGCHKFLTQEESYLGHPSLDAANGRLHRKQPGVYAVGQPRLSQSGEWMAAILACGPGSYLASLNAAVHLRTWRRRVTTIHVLAPRGRRLDGVRVQTYRRLETRDVTVRDGIPVTTVPRTLVDLSNVLTAHQLANVIHEAAFRKLFDPQTVRAAMNRANGRHNLHVLELNAAGGAGTKSELETASSLLQADPACPNRSSNTQIENLEVDFQRPQLGLVVEVDSPGHTRLRAAGHTIVRVAHHAIEQGVNGLTASVMRPPRASAGCR